MKPKMDRKKVKRIAENSSRLSNLSYDLLHDHLFYNVKKKSMIKLYNKMWTVFRRLENDFSSFDF